MLEERLLKEVKKAGKRLKAKNLACIEDFESELAAYEPQITGPSITIDIKGKYRRSTRDDCVTTFLDEPKRERHVGVEPYGDVATSLDKKLNARLSDPPAGPSVSALHLPVTTNATEAKDSARSIQSLVEMPHLARQFPLAVDLVREHCEKREKRKQLLQHRRAGSQANVTLE